MEKRSLLDQLVHGVADAIGDVREKLVFEGWFGRGAAPAAAEVGAPSIAPPAQPATMSRTHIDLDINQSVNVGTINIDMRQHTSTPMRSWDDICADVGPVRGNAPEPEHERGLDR